MENYTVKPFDIETARQHPEWVYTRVGLKARIVSEDGYGGKYKIIAMVKYHLGEGAETYTVEGKIGPDQEPKPEDLVLRVPTDTDFQKKWTIVYHWVNRERDYPEDSIEISNLFDSKADAEQAWRLWTEVNGWDYYNPQYIEIEVDMKPIKF